MAKRTAKISTENDKDLLKIETKVDPKETKRTKKSKTDPNIATEKEQPKEIKQDKITAKAIDNNIDNKNGIETTSKKPAKVVAPKRIIKVKKTDEIMNNNSFNIESAAVVKADIKHKHKAIKDGDLNPQQNQYSHQAASKISKNRAEYALESSVSPALQPPEQGIIKKKSSIKRAPKAPSTANSAKIILPDIISVVAENIVAPAIENNKNIKAKKTIQRGQKSSENNLEKPSNEQKQIDVIFKNPAEIEAKSSETEETKQEKQARRNKIRRNNRKNREKTKQALSLPKQAELPSEVAEPVVEQQEESVVKKPKNNNKKNRESKDSPKNVNNNSSQKIINKNSEKDFELHSVRNNSIKPIPYVDLSKIEAIRRPSAVKEQQEFIPINPDKLLKLTERKDPFFQIFFREVEKFAINEMLIENGSKVVIGVSGGVDSVVLLDVMAILADKYNFTLYVAHYNHNLRGKASDEDEHFVKDLAASYNVPYYLASGKVQQHAEKNNMSIEESARFLRYFFFERITRTLSADFLATAHTSDDSTETFLLNLFRGAGLTGLSGIPSRRQLVKNVMLIRPFIGIKKQKLIEYAEKRGLQWHEDESNLLDKYTRNKIRHDLLPKLKKDYSPAIVDIINRSAKLIQGADRIIHDYVRTHLQSVLTDISTDKISIKVLLFRTFDEFIRGEMLQSILMKYFRILSPSMNIIDRMLRLETSEVGAICEITKNIFAVRDRQVITIARKSTPNKVNEKIEKNGKYTIPNSRATFVLKEINIKDIEYNDNPYVEYFDFKLIPQVLTIRNWIAGDEFSPLGMKGRMKISDFLNNEKVLILEKPHVLVLATANNEIIWVCGKRINDSFKVTAETQRVLKIEIKSSDK